MKTFAPNSVFNSEVIISTLKRRGDGKEDPIRIITQVFTKEGELIAEHDPIKEPKTFLETWQEVQETKDLTPKFKIGEKVLQIHGRGVENLPGTVVAFDNNVGMGQRVSVSWPFVGVREHWSVMLKPYIGEIDPNPELYEFKRGIQLGKETIRAEAKPVFQRMLGYLIGLRERLAIRGPVNELIKEAEQITWK